jgi:hypothetical protein
MGLANVATRTLEQAFQKKRLQQVIGGIMNHAENEKISHQESHGGKGRNARGRKAITRPPSRCGLSHT